jgi:hypothetical protein
MPPKRAKLGSEALEMDAPAISSLEDLQALMASVTTETIGYRAPQNTSEDDDGLALVGEFFVCADTCKKWLQESLESIGWRANPRPDLEPVAKSHSIPELLDNTLLCFQEACALKMARLCKNI